MWLGWSTGPSSRLAKMGDSEGKVVKPALTTTAFKMRSTELVTSEE